MTKKVHPREFQVEDLVSKKILSVALKDRSKANGYLIMEENIFRSTYFIKYRWKRLVKARVLRCYKKSILLEIIFIILRNKDMEILAKCYSKHFFFFSFSSSNIIFFLAN